MSVDGGTDGLFALTPLRFIKNRAIETIATRDRAIPATSAVGKPPECTGTGGNAVTVTVTVAEWDNEPTVPVTLKT